MDRPRVLIICTDSDLMRTLHDAFSRKGDFEVCGNAFNGAKSIADTLEIHPDLVILELGSFPQAGLEAVKAIKKSNTELPIFLITNRHSMEEEKEAFSHGINVVFERDFEFNSILMNARAICGLTSSNLKPKSTTKGRTS